MVAIKKFFVSICILLISFGSSSCTPEKRDLAPPVIIPEPVFLSNQPMQSLFSSEVQVKMDTSLKDIITYMNELPGLESLSFKLTASTADIVFSQNDTLNIEEYVLLVDSDQIQIQASEYSGFFYGAISLYQLIISQNPDLGKLDGFGLNNTFIKDKPAFSYRGLHLDVARHFFPVEFIKKYIDLLAIHKMNRFHWHLTEDQAWRIQIKRYPNLTKVGAWRDSTVIGRNTSDYEKERHGGFYTQEEIKDVVRYAQQRNVTIIPEIEMPGHSTAALAAYPEYAVQDVISENRVYSDSAWTLPVATKWGVFEDIYMPSDQTFTFLENVLSEVIELFPSKYIHIGGDEAPKRQWEESNEVQKIMKDKGISTTDELQSYFIKRISEYLETEKREIIGWDEILEGGLADGATVMSWRGTKGGIEAAKAGHDVIMTPGSHCYFDHYQAEEAEEPLAIGGFTPLKKVYEFNPIPEELNELEARFVIGAQGNVWTEYMKTSNQVEYMAYPRAIALSEVLWTGSKRGNYSDFVSRLKDYSMILDLWDLNYARHHLSKDN